MLKSLTIDELEVGMFVKNIILKDSDKKVKNQGVVNSLKTIESLRKRGVVKVLVEVEEAANSAEVVETSSEDSSKKPQEDIEETSLAKEFSHSCDIYDEATENVKSLFLNSSVGKPISPESMNVLAGEITDSILRNEHAMTILTRIRQKSNYQWEHAINSGVLLCGFALYLGLNKESVKEVTLGALLHDIGTAKVSKTILEKQEPLTQNEMSVVKKHVFWGIELAKREGFTLSLIHI